MGSYLRWGICALRHAFRGSKYINQKPPSINWKDEIYDLYGGMKTYKDAFTQFDDKIDYLSEDLQILISKLIKKEEKINIFDDFKTTLLYLKDGIKYIRKHSRSKK